MTSPTYRTLTAFRCSASAAVLLLLVGFAELTFVIRAWLEIGTMTLRLLPTLSPSAAILLAAGVAAVALFTILCLMVPVLVIRGFYDRDPRAARDVPTAAPARPVLTRS